MTADERRQFNMLVRVRNFGNKYAPLWASSPAAVQALARVGSTIDDVTATGMSKTAAAAATRSDRRFALRHELRGLLRRAARLSRNLLAEGQQIQVLVWRGSKSDTALITAAGYFAKEMATCDEFRKHGMAPERITTLATLLDRAVMEQFDGRCAFSAARGEIRRLLASGTRAAQRLDLVLVDDIAADAAVQAEWKQLRRLEPRRTRGPAVLEADLPRVADDQVAIHGQ